MKRSRVVTRLGSVAISAAILVAPVILKSQSPGAFDVLIKNGHILDGTGSPWYAADIGIRGDRIVDIGKLGDAPAAKVFDAQGLIVSPGFVDMLGQSETS